MIGIAEDGGSSRVTGRHRIGKTTLVQRALNELEDVPVVYVEIPDSAPAGVLSAVADAKDTFDVDQTVHPRPRSLLKLARTVGPLAEAGYVVAWTSSSTSVANTCSSSPLICRRRSTTCPAEPRRSRAVWSSSAHYTPSSSPSSMTDTPRSTTGSLTRSLFLSNLFEGVPKFYGDCHEQGVLGEDRTRVLARMFFRSSSPLRSEAENWFLSKLRGRYVLVEDLRDLSLDSES